ncbi:hypothetical protein LEP1GSC124_4088 [Leptospira interrogans serovar Pyrogenes str. 200701872]|uniref:Uncharacterized protein n=1 Tax=Leptospira interrogans serovar Pyrogenes str. 200701872 TaxID=1193029 RepID=M6ZIR4_LEPIR|nr:hypothetical protein LEP1GSC124_4088 [Leptospira interrogans serovar Pyrogenes str. 200701872]
MIYLKLLSFFESFFLKIENRKKKFCYSKAQISKTNEL